MVAARSQRLGAWMHAMRGDLTPPTGVDAPAVNAILIASAEHLVLSAAATGAFAAVPLKTDADWERVRGALKSLAGAVYGLPIDDV